MELKPAIEIFKGEGLKTAAEIALSSLSKFPLGEGIIEAYAFGMEGRIEDPVLHTTVAGIEFENPIMVGAGWDKKGRAVNGLYRLGFSGVEVGTVPLFGQPGNLQPRLWTLDKKHGVGLNRLGFNSPGVEVVDRSLNAHSKILGKLGINIGLNKLMTHEQAPWAHAAVIPHLYNYANYFALGVSSPNTPGLRELQRREPLRAIIQAVQYSMEECGGQKPLFIKIAPDLDEGQLDDILGVAIEEKVAGIIAINTTNSEALKAKYGKQHEAGGLSGAEWEYQAMALRMIFDIYERAGDKLEIIGVGGTNSPETAIEKMLAGASVLQMVTAIREHNGRAVACINRGIIDYCGRHKVKNIKELIGAATKRGPKYPHVA